MSRLLLVDDNPSIHRIAESLLAPTDVELVCVDSAEEALDRFARGEHFDVALVDTAMPGMDGWTLLARLREMEATARLPIALMAGVLDPVDPAKLARAPVQGFLKKPIELRELGDRVKALLATAVPPPASDPSTFATVPATPARDLVRRAELALPEFRPEAEPRLEAVEVPSPAMEALPELVIPAPEDDLLMLSAEDLWPEEAPVGAPSALMEEPAPVGEPAAVTAVHLELEELDLESLQDLASGSLPPEPALAAPLAVPPAALAEAGAPGVEALAEESLASLNTFESLDAFSGGIDLPPLPEPPDVRIPPVAELAAGAAAGLAAPALLGHAHEPVPPPANEVAAPAAAESFHQPTEIDWPMPAGEPLPVLATGQAAAALGQAPAAPGQSPLGSAQIQGLLADPVLMDALVKAVVARMGDQVIREIAWEVMPDLAERLQR